VPAAGTEVSPVVACQPSGSCLAVFPSGATDILPASGPSVRVGEPVGSHHPIISLACGSGFCAALDADGYVFHSMTSAGQPGRWAAIASRLPADPGGKARLDCGRAVCVASGPHTLVEASATSGADTWHERRVDTTNAIDTLTCASSTLCLAGDTGGHIFATRDPAAAHPIWTGSEVDPGGWITHLSCASIDWCTATDGAGHLFVSTDPSAGGGRWTIEDVDGVRSLWSISCVDKAFCAASDGAGGIVTSTDPSGGPTAWRRVLVTGDTIWEITCPSVELCVAVDQSGAVLWSTDPTGGRWVVVPLGIAGIGALACPTTHLCVIGDGAGQVLTSTDPTGGRDAWRTASVDTKGWIASALDGRHHPGRPLPSVRGHRPGPGGVRPGRSGVGP
jgi:hypothetical protein